MSGARWLCRDPQGAEEVPGGTGGALQQGPGCGEGDALPGAALEKFGVPFVLRAKVAVPGRDRTEQQLALGRKVCKESTEHRLPGVSEGKFMHRL